jgi:hypothetical protein
MPVFELPEGFGNHLQINSISGSVTNILGARAFVGANGYVGKKTNLNAANGISGIAAPSKLFLAGVFMTDSLASDPAPPKLNFYEIGTDFESLAPQLNQTFYIGDGLIDTENSVPQRFIIPEGATRLFFGYGDGSNFQGDPRAYSDNYGWLDVRFQITGSALTGDLNADGFMGIEDLNIVLEHWNQNVTPGDYLMGDYSGDGFTGLEDLNVVLGNWNAGTPPAIESLVPVPEPASGVIVLMTLTALIRRH